MDVNTEAERRLFQADDDRCRAMTAHDLDTLETLLADDVVYTHSSAMVDTKQGYLEALRSGRARYLFVQREQAQVRLYGQVAVMHGRVIIKIQVDGHQKDLNNLFQSVWVQREGRWQLASWASTVIPPAS